MRAYSIDLRQRVLVDCDAGLNTKAVAIKYSVSPAWVRRLKQRRREWGEVAPRPSRNKVCPKLSDHRERLHVEVQRRPDATLAELRQWLLIDRGVVVSIHTLWRELRTLKLSYKKRRFTPPSSTGPT